MRPTPIEYGTFYEGYVSKVPEEEILPVLKSQKEEVVAFWRTIPESLASTVHAPYTWNIRQVLDHLVDGERIFAYRLLRIARGDTTPLSGYDELAYAVASEEQPAPLKDIVDSFDSLRSANLLLVKNLHPNAWCRIGTSNDSPMSVRALAYIMAGHIRHHDAILRKRLAS